MNMWENVTDLLHPQLSVAKLPGDAIKVSFVLKTRVKKWIVNMVDERMIQYAKYELTNLPNATKLVIHEFIILF